jgi:4-hydroxybenzoate polyprenyltransferase
MTDFREDQKKGIRTTAIMLGDVPIRLLATLSGAAAAALIFTAGFFMQKGIEVAWECVPLLAVTAVIPVMKLSDPRNAGLARWFQRVSALFSGTAAWVSVELIPNVIAKL